MLLLLSRISVIVTFVFIDNTLSVEPETENKHLFKRNFTSKVDNHETIDCLKVTLITCSVTAIGLLLIIACLMIYCSRHRETQDCKRASESVEDQQLTVDTSGLWQHLKVLRFDVNTIHKNLWVSKEGDAVIRVDKDQVYTNQQERFLKYPQVLCTTALTGRCYWEILFTGGCEVSVCYRDPAGPNECRFGLTNRSWSLVCSENGFTAVHDSVTVRCETGPANRVAVDLDHANGVLSFYKVACGKIVLIHRFNSTFSEPLYAGFRVWRASSVKLCRLHNIDKHEWEYIDLKTPTVQSA